MSKASILCLCTGNSCRSQMAEGWARALRSESFEAFSAGVERHGLNPHAGRVMAEAGVDISGQQSRRLDDPGQRTFDYVVTVCSHARDCCPTLPAHTRFLHAGFDDPPALARAARGDSEAPGHRRRVRDEIRARVEALPDAPLSLAS